MALLTVTPITRAGVTASGASIGTSLTACSVGGDTYDNSTAPELELNNASVAPITLYAAIYADGQTIVQGRSWVIPAATRMRIAPMTGQYNNPSTGIVSLTYSGVTTLTIGLFSR